MCRSQMDPLWLPEIQQLHNGSCAPCSELLSPAPRSSRRCACGASAHARGQRRPAPTPGLAPAPALSGLLITAHLTAVPQCTQDARGKPPLFQVTSPQPSGGLGGGLSAVPPLPSSHRCVRGWGLTDAPPAGHKEQALPLGPLSVPSLMAAQALHSSPFRQDADPLSPERRPVS